LVAILTIWIAKATVVAARAAGVSAGAAERGIDVNLSVLTEMRAQRVSAAQPLVIGQIDETYSFRGRPEIVRVSLMNSGNGPALNVLGRFDLYGISYSGPSLGFRAPIPILATGPSNFVAELRAPRERLQETSTVTEGKGEFLTSYSDIYGRKFVVAIPIVFDQESNTVVVSDRINVEIHDPLLTGSALTGKFQAPA
jgi:hypothetical protein